MIDAGFVTERCHCAVLGHCQEFPFVGYAGVGVHGEIAVVYLIDYGVVDVFECRAAVFAPSLGICGAHVDDGRALSVHTHGLRPYAGGLLKEIAVLRNLESVEFSIGHRRDLGAPCAGI